MFAFFSQAFSQGGIWMYAILAIQIVSIAIIAERTYYLFFIRSKNQKDLAGRFESDIKKGDLSHALSKANDLERSQPLGSIASVGIQSAINMGGKQEIHAKMHEVINFENEKLEKRTSNLAMIGNVSKLIGLLGTITGMIKSFSAISMVGAVEKASILSNGISEAMNCTAYGLIVAIPALIMYSVLNNRTRALEDDLNQASTKILNWLSFSFEAIPNSKKRSV